MTAQIKIGTCGFRANKEEYARQLAAVEVQHTFYQPPQIKTLERWRESVPDDFEFAIKAWQLITHEAKSPTFKRLKKTLTETERAEAGYFKPTAIVEEAWKTTLSCAKALRAKIVLFQCPVSFKPYEENIENLKNFFNSVERGDLNFAWEPRGNWGAKTVKNLCEDLDLWNAVDPFSKQTETPDRCYYRMHGRTGFRYKYEEDELTELAATLPADKTAYVFFNNRYMLEDALLFKSLL